MSDLRLKCTKFDFGGWGSAPDPAGGAYSYSAPPDPLAGLGGPTSKWRGGTGLRGGKGKGREGGKGMEERKGEGGGGERRSVLDLPLKYMVTLHMTGACVADCLAQGRI